MNHLFETHAMLCALAPQSIAKAGAVTGVYADMSGRKNFCFAVTAGAVAASAALKAELLAADDSSGTNAETVGTVTYTAPTGGVTSHVILISGHVTASRRRYLAVKVTNTVGEAAIVAGAVLVADAAYYPEAASGTTLVV